jgi:peptidoglycan/LPS O-acetylase OafA/YrhL
MIFDAAALSAPISAVAVAFVATTIIAAALYGFIEVPMVQLGRRLTARAAV